MRLSGFSIFFDYQRHSLLFAVGLVVSKWDGAYLAINLLGHGFRVGVKAL